MKRFQGTEANCWGTWASGQLHIVSPPNLWGRKALLGLLLSPNPRPRNIPQLPQSLLPT